MTADSSLEPRRCCCATTADAAAIAALRVDAAPAWSARALHASAAATGPPSTPSLPSPSPSSSSSSLSSLSVAEIGTPKYRYVPPGPRALWSDRAHAPIDTVSGGSYTWTVCSSAAERSTPADAACSSGGATRKDLRVRAVSSAATAGGNGSTASGLWCTHTFTSSVMRSRDSPSSASAAGTS